MKNLDDIETIADILEAETNLFHQAEKYGESFHNAMGFNELLSDFIDEVRPDAWIFILFLAQIKKHALLAILSATRQHHVQSMLNIRQVLEAGANASYGLANPNKDDFVVKENSMLVTKDSLDNKRRQWLEKNHKENSDFIKNMKDSINRSCAHSNMIYAFNNFSMEDHAFHTPFFDTTKDHWVKTNFWMIGNVLMGLMDLFNGINKGVGTLTLNESFARRLLELEQQNHKIKADLEKEVVQNTIKVD
jgi:hypothetical protein